MRNVRDAQIRSGQKLPARLDADVAEIAYRRDAEQVCESVHDIVFVQMGNLGQRIQSDVLHVVGVDILLELVAFTADPDGGNRLGIQVEIAQKVDDQHFQEVLTDQFMMRPVRFDLLQQDVHIKKKILFVLPAVENEIVIFVRGKKIQSLYAENDVFHGRRSLGNLRVGNVGVDDNKIVFPDRMTGIVDQIFSAALADVTQLCKIMRVGKAAPVALVSGIGDIKELCLDGFDVLDFDRIS